MLNLSHIFEYTGNQFVIELKANITRQGNSKIELNRFQPIAESTLKTRQRAKGVGRRTFKNKNMAQSRRWYQKLAAVAKTRLLFTRRFSLNAFKFVAGNDYVKVYVNRDYYHNEEATGGRSMVTYRDIVAYNQKGSPEVNTKIQNPPLIFPDTFEQVAKMDSIQLFKRKLQKEVPNIQRQIIGAGVKVRNTILL